MASVQEAGTIRIYVKRPNGDKKKLWQSHVAMAAPAGGAPDAALTSVKTPDQLSFAPLNPTPINNDDIIEVEFTAEAADGIDVSDGIWLIPLTVNGVTQTIGAGDFANPAGADYTTVIAIPTVVAGYKITEAGPGSTVRFGGGPIYVDFQDDT